MVGILYYSNFLEFKKKKKIRETRLLIVVNNNNRTRKFRISRIKLKSRREGTIFGDGDRDLKRVPDAFYDRQ